MPGGWFRSSKRRPGRPLLDELVEERAHELARDTARQHEGADVPPAMRNALRQARAERILRAIRDIRGTGPRVDLVIPDADEAMLARLADRLEQLRDQLAAAQGSGAAKDVNAAGEVMGLPVSGYYVRMRRSGDD